jgi:ribose transport system ATP-binding protein
VLQISDRVYGLKDGVVVAEMLAGETTVRQLHRFMVGRELHAEYYREARQRSPKEEIVMQAEALTVRGLGRVSPSRSSCRKVDFVLRRGEILGIAGVIGSGREALTRTPFGFLPQSSGPLTVLGRSVQLTSRDQAATLGIGYIPRERASRDLSCPRRSCPIFPWPVLARSCEPERFKPGVKENLAESWVRKLRVRAPSVDVSCLNLSGGNQAESRSF